MTRRHYQSTSQIDITNRGKHKSNKTSSKLSIARVCLTKLERVLASFRLFFWQFISTVGRCSWHLAARTERISEAFVSLLTLAGFALGELVCSTLKRLFYTSLAQPYYYWQWRFRAGPSKWNRLCLRSWEILRVSAAFVASSNDRGRSILFSRISLGRNF